MKQEDALRLTGRWSVPMCVTTLERGNEATRQSGFERRLGGEHGIALFRPKNLIFVLENLSSQWVALYTQTLLPYLVLPRMLRGRYRAFAPVAATGWKTDVCAENNKVIRLGDWVCDTLLR